MTGEYQWVMLAIAIVSLGFTAYIAVRAQRWRETDDAKALLTRVGSIDNRLTTVEQEVKALATREDVAALRAKVDGVCDVVKNTEAGVNRIEAWLVEGRAK